MKKILVISISLILLTSYFYIIISKIDNKKNYYRDYIHNNLKNKRAIYYINQTDTVKEKYAIADLTTDAYEDNIFGFYYEVKTNDFILLKTIKTQCNLENLGKFVGNKYYGLNGTNLFMIELNNENSKYKELNLKYNNINVIPTSFEILDNKQIKVKSTIFSNDQITDENFLCSLKNYECEIIDY